MHETSCDALHLGSYEKLRGEAVGMLTHKRVVTSSHITELAILARIWTAPSMIQSTYAVANRVVQAALKQKKTSLRRYLFTKTGRELRYGAQ